MEVALRTGFGVLPYNINDRKLHDALLASAFALVRERVDSETLAYVKDSDAYPMGQDPPYDAFMGDRLLLHRHMRLAFEDGADWLVEVLEKERAEVAERVAYVVALEEEAGLR